MRNNSRYEAADWWHVLALLSMSGHENLTRASAPQKHQHTPCKTLMNVQQTPGAFKRDAGRTRVLCKRAPVTGQRASKIAHDRVPSVQAVRPAGHQVSPTFAMVPDLAKLSHFDSEKPEFRRRHCLSLMCKVRAEGPRRTQFIFVLQCG
jgi:hypothetical protein